MATPECLLPAEEEASPTDDALGDTLGDAPPVDANEVDEAAATHLAAAAASEEEEAAWAEVEPPPEANMEAQTLKLPSNATTRRLGESSRVEAAAARGEWMTLGEEVKPRHLRVPKDLYHVVDRLCQSTRQDPLDVIAAPPRHGHGPLEPRGNVDPSIIRAFISRLDGNHDNLVEPQELADLSLKRKLGVKDEQIQNMFQRIIAARPHGKQGYIGISAPEIFNEMKVTKHWMSTIDLDVTCEDGKNYHVATEQETLVQWCSDLVAEIRGQLPADDADAEQLCSLPDSWSPPEIDRFFALLLGMRTADGSLLHSRLKSVQTLLKASSDSVTALAVKPRIFQMVSVVGQRQDWGWRSPPYRSLWLRFFRAAGLQPLQPIVEVSGKKAAQAEMEATITPVIQPNIITAKRKSQVTKEGIVRVREPRPKVAIRTGEFGDASASLPMQSEAELPCSWDEKRTHSELLVNHVISQGSGACRATPPPPGYEDGDAAGGLEGTGKPSGTVAFTFDARRRFLQVTAKHGRDSEQQRSIGAEKKEMARQTSLLGQAGLAVANVGVTFRGPHSHLGFSHHHLTNSVEPSRLQYEKDLGHAWNGSYVDHTKEAPQKADVLLSKMTAEERDRQFSTHFNNGTIKKDNQAARVDGLEGVKDIMDSYKAWQNHEFRHDLPQRHGKYGRRVFDAQVRETQIQNKISGIDSKPMEEFNRQQDLVHEFLDRSLPPNQQKHFETYLPPSQFPYRKEVDMHGYPMTGNGNYV